LGATFAIPKAGTIAHIRLTGDNLAAIDQAHPPSRRKLPLVMPCSVLEFPRCWGRFWWISACPLLDRRTGTGH
jgi:hypothetical protein